MFSRNVGKTSSISLQLCLLCCFLLPLWASIITSLLTPSPQTTHEVTGTNRVEVLLTHYLDDMMEGSEPRDPCQYAQGISHWHFTHFTQCHNSYLTQWFFIREEIKKVRSVRATQALSRCRYVEPKVAWPTVGNISWFQFLINSSSRILINYLFKKSRLDVKSLLSSAQHSILVHGCN